MLSPSSRHSKPSGHLSVPTYIPPTSKLDFHWVKTMFTRKARISRAIVPWSST